MYFVYYLMRLNYLALCKTYHFSYYSSKNFILKFKFEKNGPLIIAYLIININRFERKSNHEFSQVGKSRLNFLRLF